MATTTFIPVSEYLATSYRPDRDYVDGEVRARNLGERPHAALQGILFAIFHANRQKWKIVALPKQRVQVSRTHYRVPDLCVVSKNDPVHVVITTAPMICIEILSSGDSISSIQERADEYTAMGVGYIWVADPISRRVWAVSSDGLYPVREDLLVVPGTPIEISLPKVFAELDELLSNQ